MKRIYIICIILVFVVLITIGLLKGCSALLINTLYEDLGNRDWRISLCDGYEIHRINSNRIILVRCDQNNGNSVCISEYVNAYRYNAQYIQIFCAKDGKSDLLGVDSDEDKYYLVDVQLDNINGPYSKTEFDDIYAHISDDELGEWIFTYPRPYEAVFD